MVPCLPPQMCPFSTRSLFGLAGGAPIPDAEVRESTPRTNEGGLRFGCCISRAADFPCSVSLPPLERNLGGAACYDTSAWSTVDCLPVCPKVRTPEGNFLEA